MSEQFRLLLASLEAFGREVAGFMPRLLVAVVLLVGGWLLARSLRRLTIRGLRVLKLDAAAERAGIEGFLIQGGIRLTTVTLLGEVMYWIVNLAVVLAALNVLGLRAAAELFGRLVLYLPNLVAAVIVVIFGGLFAQVVGTLLRTYLANLGVGGADAISGLVRWGLVLFVVSLSLEQLSIGGQILISAFQIAFGALCLALALAFGLGGRDWAARVIDNAFAGGRRSGGDR